MQNNPYLSGNYAPVKDELEVQNLKIIGEIPKDLTGIYMRNGLNPAFPPISYTYPLDGDGMIHAIYLTNGEAHYRNRYVETKGLLKERKAGKALYGGPKLKQEPPQHFFSANNQFLVPESNITSALVPSNNTNSILRHRLTET